MREVVPSITLTRQWPCFLRRHIGPFDPPTQGSVNAGNSREVVADYASVTEPKFGSLQARHRQATRWTVSPAYLLPRTRRVPTHLTANVRTTTKISVQSSTVHVMAHECWSLCRNIEASSTFLLPCACGGLHHMRAAPFIHRIGGCMMVYGK